MTGMFQIVLIIGIVDNALKVAFIVANLHFKFMYHIIRKYENGKLEKREVGTGKTLWGNYVEITSGLTMDDFIAFPYGKDVKAGADTVEAGIEELYASNY